VNSLFCIVILSKSTERFLYGTICISRASKPTKTRHMVSDVGNLAYVGENVNLDVAVRYFDVRLARRREAIPTECCALNAMLCKALSIDL
jgi:hypothetical protein